MHKMTIIETKSTKKSVRYIKKNPNIFSKPSPANSPIQTSMIKDFRYLTDDAWSKQPNRSISCARAPDVLPGAREPGEPPQGQDDKYVHRGPGHWERERLSGGLPGEVPVLWRLKDRRQSRAGKRDRTPQPPLPEVRGQGRRDRHLCRRQERNGRQGRIHLMFY